MIKKRFATIIFALILFCLALYLIVIFYKPISLKIAEITMHHGHPTCENMAYAYYELDLNSKTAIRRSIEQSGINTCQTIPPEGNTNATARVIDLHGKTLFQANIWVVTQRNYDQIEKDGIISGGMYKITKTIASFYVPTELYKNTNLTFQIRDSADNSIIAQGPL